MAEWEASKSQLSELGVTVVAASVDHLDHAKEMAGKGLSYPVGYGVTKEEAGALGAWWSDDRGGFIQPAEFLLGRGGVVLGAMYASGPVGRMSVEEATHLITGRETRRRQDEQGTA